MADTSSKPIERVGLACVQCRARHVKCDSTQPTCRRCARDRKECIYKKSRRGGLDKAALARRKERLEREAAEQAQQVQQSLHDTHLSDPAFTAENSLGVGTFDQVSPSTDMSTAMHIEVDSPNSVELSFHGSTDRLLDVYHDNFWPAFPFTLPNAFLHQRKSTANHDMTNVLYAQHWIGSIYAPWTSSEPYYQIASQALTSETVPRDPWTIQALILMAFAEHYCDKKPEARKSADKAIEIALELQMNTQAFARIYGEGSAVLEESWRRTYLFLTVLDQHLAVVTIMPFFALRDVPNLVDLPCEDEDYVSGQIPPPATWQDYETRELADVEVTYPSLVYMVDMLQLVIFVMRMFIKFGAINDALINAVDAKNAVWQSLLPISKRDPLRKDGTLDEIMFTAHEMSTIIMTTVHRPLSSLSFSPEELLTESFKSVSLFTKPCGTNRSGHTARTLKAIDIHTKLLSIPCAIERHSVLTSVIVARITMCQISACNILLDDYALTIARDRVRLSIGFLNTMGTVWPLAKKMAAETKHVARATLSSLPSMTMQQQNAMGEVEIPRDEFLWPIAPSAQIDIYAGLSLPVDWEAAMMGYTSSSNSSTM